MRAFILLTLFFLLSGVSFADDVNETIAIFCESSSNEMKIKAVFVNRSNMNINKIPGGYNLELRSCDFLNDTKVKVELRDGVASDRGRCGANPPITLQITSANGERLEFDFSPRCGGLLIESAVIHREYVKVCKYTEVNHKAPWVPEKFASEPGFKCKTY